jgi:GntR family transcriptional regulator/GntR family frlABCD operon transcriptional regulator
MGILSLQGVTQAVGLQRELSTKILKKPEVSTWPSNFMYKLSDRERGLGCIQMTRLRLLDNTPVMMEKTYLVNIHLPRFCQKKFENRSLFDTLRIDYGVEMVGGKQKIRAIIACEEISNLLNLPKGKAIIHMERSIKTNKKNLRLFSELFCNTDNYYIIDKF